MNCQNDKSSTGGLSAMPIRRWSIWLLAVLLFGGASALQAQTQPPALFFSDLESGANSGGENVNGAAGAYVTLYGNFFGSTQGSSTVTWNGLNCLRVVPPTGAYTGWGMAHLWYQEIIVQLNSTCTPGPGNFVVTTSGGTSNGIPFTVRSGNIYCVSKTGSDSNSGKFPSCWANPSHAFSSMSAGDTTYWQGGVTVTGGGGLGGLDWGASGSAGNPVAMVSYPGATPQPGVNCSGGGCSNGIGIRCSVGFPSNCQYLTLAGLSIIGSGMAWESQYTANNQRFVGNYFSCTGPPGAVGCFETSQTSQVKFLGNEVANIVSSGTTGKQYHGVYFSTDTNHVEMAWNSVHNNNSCRAVQIHSSPVNLTTGYNQFDLSLHDNLIHDDPCDGILFATVDPSQGKVEAYNNVIYHVGLGPDPNDGEASYSCIRVAQYTNNGSPGTGTVEIYNNTLSDCGSHVGTFGLSGTLSFQPGTVGVNYRNNIAYQSSGEFFTNSGSAFSGLTLTGSSNNIWFGGNQAAPSWSSNNITVDPLLVNRAANNLHLQSGSPALDAGITIASTNSYKGYQVWNGRPMDRDGVTRAQGSGYDIGAYEFFAGGSTVQKPNPPTNLTVIVK